ncbi:MAG: FAD-binding oxidoreductase, partial [Cytophagaceae bacterium]
MRETMTAADAAGVLVLTGNCNGVGTLGALLGGGYGNLLGQFGLGVDTILEMRVVTADGQLRTISASNEKDLFWAMRGAGPNFGIVTAATVKAQPTSKDKRSAWCGALINSEDKLEQIVDAIQRLE